ncbi:M14 family zinc carboxypeptidase [Aliikangiella sp. G2MR2-5]|uniref:M14 family zinc carboxypeptidase n=1 Tax=Aliikangiella sp. G2MR2-5 TaxID=2788943 RepID=UPI0018AA779D|nr:M14 family zinc carboxypeptidase [Aliikangiella sp. G2MR2-5]
MNKQLIKGPKTKIYSSVRKAVLAALAITSASSGAAATLSDSVSPYLVTAPSSDVARKVAISYHHGILKTDFKNKQLVIDLTPDEVEKLRFHGIQVKYSTEWETKFRDYQLSIQQKKLENSVNKSAGIPGFECYPTVEETMQQGALLASENDQYAEWIDIGDSWKKANSSGGYDLMVLKITNRNIEKEKPVLFIHSAMHARELTPAALTLDFAKKLLNEKDTDADIQWLLDEREIHILFHMNPDGRKIAETGEYQRKNANSNHCPGGNVGVDLNRNFAYFWNTTEYGSSGNECDQTYRGKSAESEPETQAVSNYIRSLFADSRGDNESDAAPADTSGMHLDIHSYSQLILWPYGHTDTPSPNANGFEELGNKLAWFNNYTPQQSVGLYPTDGTSDDVSYGELGVAAITYELGTDFFQACNDYTSKIKPDNLRSLIYAAKVTEAPYLLSSGPEVELIKLNGSSENVVVARGANLDIVAQASAINTKKSSLGRSVSKVEYSIDKHFNDAQSTVSELPDNDGNLTGVEEFSGQINTAELSEGRHTIYFRAYNQSGQSGVVSAMFFTIGENSLPAASFEYSCQELSCSFNAGNSSDSDGDITNFQWQFGDGVEGYGEIIEHTYPGEGSYEVVLTVYDDKGARASTAQSFDVKQESTEEEDEEEENEPEEENVSSSSGGGSLGGWLIAMFAFTYFRRILK